VKDETPLNVPSEKGTIKMNDYVHTGEILFALLVVAAGIFVFITAYFVASRSWHKGKKEFVDRMTADHCNEKD
jgi:hypothetical protein